MDAVGISCRRRKRAPAAAGGQAGCRGASGCGVTLRLKGCALLLSQVRTPRLPMLEPRPPVELPPRASAIAGARARAMQQKSAKRMRQLGSRLDIGKSPCTKMLASHMGLCLRRQKLSIGISAGDRSGGPGALLDRRPARPQITGLECVGADRCMPVGGCRRRARRRFLARRRGEGSVSRLSLFNSPLLLGFDHFERALDRVSKVSTDGYPPV